MSTEQDILQIARECVEHGKYDPDGETFVFTPEQLNAFTNRIRSTGPQGKALRARVPMTEMETLKACRIGAVATNAEGKVDLWPSQFRDMLKGAFIDGIKKAERHHGITGGDQS